MWPRKGPFVLFEVCVPTVEYVGVLRSSCNFFHRSRFRFLRDGVFRRRTSGPGRAAGAIWVWCDPAPWRSMAGVGAGTVRGWLSPLPVFDTDLPSELFRRLGPHLQFFVLFLVFSQTNLTSVRPALRWRVQRGTLSRTLSLASSVRSSAGIRVHHGGVVRLERHVLLVRLSSWKCDEYIICSNADWFLSL
jgi:hypothetical protein